MKINFGTEYIQALSFEDWQWIYFEEHADLIIQFRNALINGFDAKNKKGLRHFFNDLKEMNKELDEGQRLLLQEYRVNISEFTKDFNSKTIKLIRPETLKDYYLLVVKSVELFDSLDLEGFHNLNKLILNSEVPRLNEKHKTE